MAKFLDKTQVQTPVKRFRDFDMSCQQLTTAFFMRPTIAYAVELPKHSLKCNLKSYARLQPLLKPVLGSVQVHNRAFYVPFRTVWPCWDSFLTASPFTTPSGTAVINAVPTISHDVIVNAFRERGNGLATWSVISSGMDTPDFYAYNDLDTPAVSAYYLTPFGRHAMKILNQLGYRINFGNGNIVPGQTPYNLSAISKESLSFLPLLCYAKLFLDWMYPAQYAHSGIAAFIDGMMQRNFRYDASENDLMRILEFTAWAYYGNDYFTAAFDTPTAPSAGYDVGLTIPDITQTFPVDYYGASSANPIYGSQVEFGPNGTPRVVGQPRQIDPGASAGSNYTYPSSFPYFTQYLDDSLKKLTNWQRRHQLVGARVLDRYLADFGVVPTWEQLKRSQFVGSQSFPIQFQDVMSNSDTVSDSAGRTTGAQLGAYAGKGVAYDGQGNFEFSSDEFGFFIIVNTVVPDIAYYQGMSRHVLHKRMTDFLSGEWESLGTQPVLASELAFGFNDGGNNINEIFGFLPRYSEYKCGKDMITGLFNYNSVNRGLMAWSTARAVNASDRHGIGFLRGDDAWQYARIFYGDVTGPESEIDKFFFVHRVNIKVSMQASPMYDVYDFDEPEGDDIQMQVNGAKV